MTKEQIEKMMAKQKEVAKTKPFMNTEMGQYAYQLGFEDGADWALSHQWVSVEDELPPDYRNVLIVTCSYGYYIAFYSNRHQCFVVENDVDIPNVTHWMPIPPLAEEGGNDE